MTLQEEIDFWYVLTSTSQKSPNYEYAIPVHSNECFIYINICCPWWSNGYHACRWTQGLWVQTRRYHVVRYYSVLKNHAEYEGDTSCTKFMAISHQVSPALLPGVSAGYCQRALVDKSGMIKAEIGNTKYVSNGHSA
jgi:hypothetical protein